MTKKEAASPPQPKATTSLYPSASNAVPTPPMNNVRIAAKTAKIPAMMAMVPPARFTLLSLAVHPHFKRLRLVLFDSHKQQGSIIEEVAASKANTYPVIRIEPTNCSSKADD